MQHNNTANTHRSLRALAIISTSTKWGGHPLIRVCSLIRSNTVIMLPWTQKTLLPGVLFQALPVALWVVTDATALLCVCRQTQMMCDTMVEEVQIGMYEKPAKRRRAIFSSTPLKSRTAKLSVNFNKSQLKSKPLVSTTYIQWMLTHEWGCTVLILLIYSILYNIHVLHNIMIDCAYIDGLFE